MLKEVKPMKRILPLLMIVAVVALFVAISAPQAGDHANIGADKCGKMCHKVQYTSWLETKHAKSWDTLQNSDMAKDDSCNGCHTLSAEFAGVQCESCHGPGADYKSMSVMKDVAKATEAGLVAKPGEAFCKKCHNPDSPTYKEFNYAEAVKTGIHDFKK